MSEPIYQADLIDVAIRKSAVTPAVPQIRALCEASLLRWYVENFRPLYRVVMQMDSLEDITEAGQS